MNLVSKTISFVCSSNEELNQAIDKRNNGSEFSVNYTDGISIPYEAVLVELFVTQVNIWNVSYNISTAIGNNRLHYGRNSINEAVFLKTILIPDGQYSVEALNIVLAQQLEENGDPPDLFTILISTSNSRIIIDFLDTNCLIDFTQLNSVGPLLGFESRIVNSPTGSPHMVLGDTTAKFNRITSYLIQSSELAPNGIPVNNRNMNVMVHVPIEVKPGSLINYQPTMPTLINADHLRGHGLKFWGIRLSDQSGRDIDTVGEDFSVMFSIRYTVPV